MELREVKFSAKEKTKQTKEENCHQTSCVWEEPNIGLHPLHYEKELTFVVK